VNIVVSGTTALVAAAEKGHQDIVSLLRITDVCDTGALITAAEEGARDGVAMLLDRGADVNMVVHDTTALVAAVEEGHRRTVLLLLERGAKVNMAVHDTTALVAAVEKGHRRTVSLLLDGGANVNMKVHDTTALVAAVEKRRQRTVPLLLGRGANVNTIVHDTTALVAAVEKGHWRTVSLLLKQGANVDITVHDTTALVAAVGKRRRRTVSLLLDGGANVNMRVHDTTALVAAVEKGHQRNVSLLLERGANMNMIVHDTTALVAAVEKGHQDIVLLLLDQGSDVDVNMIVHDTTALVAAVEKWHQDIVSLLLDRGSDVDVNIIVHDTTALVAAVEEWHQGTALLLLDRGAPDIVSLLLDRGADVNMVVHDTTALVAAAERGHHSVVSVLLRKGADMNMVVHDTTALVVAVEGGHQRIVSALLGKGADVNKVVHDTTALIAATEKGSENIEMLRLLLGEATDPNLNIVAGKYGTALIAAICTCQSPASDYSGNVQQPVLLSILLDRDPDVGIVAGDYGTALIATISKLQFTEQTGCNQQDNQQDAKWQWAFLKRLLSSKYLTRDHINVEVGEHGSPITAAISKGNVQLLRLLIERGGDVKLADSCGTAVRAALAAGWDSKRVQRILQYLLGKGADINIVSSHQFGSALGQAAYMGDTGLVSFLLECKADPLHVGGTYNRTSTGEYPTALDAAQSLGNKAQPDLISVLSDAMECSGGPSQRQRLPPFPMPYTRPDAIWSTTTLTDPKCFRNLPVHANLTAQQADISCTALTEEFVIKMLVQLVIGTDTDLGMPEFKQYEDWIRNDVRYFVTERYDFGTAYAAARVGWRHFDKPDFMHLVPQHRDQWRRIAHKIDNERVNSIYQDNKGQEMIRLPYNVMPRRLWDLKSNRVVEFRMLHSELLSYKSTMERQPRKAGAKAFHSNEALSPVYWAISHSWEASVNPVETPINQYQWQVPLPDCLDLEHGVRQELLTYGIEYVWLDVLCLRQHTSDGLALNETKQEEWKLDVPTIGNIYRAAKGIVRYFNGLGRSFTTKGWDNDRHWLRRAWTLQEIKTENSTINGGIPRGSTRTSNIMNTRTSNIMNTRGKMAGEIMTLRRAIHPVLKLAADVDSPSGCSLYALVREMSKRKSTKSTDKVAGLVGLLRLTELPTYDEKITDNEVWTKCIGLLPLARKIELLFNFPYPSDKHQWFPTWSELMTWPEVDPYCEYSSTVHVNTEGRRHLEKQVLSESDEATKGSLFMSDIWALSPCFLTHGSAREVDGSAREVDDEGFKANYEVRVKTTGKVYGFYGPYVEQKPIATMSSEGQPCEFTITTADLGHSNNWVVCKVVKGLKARCSSMSKASTCDPSSEATYESGESDQHSSELDIEVLRKVGVLRTDFCGEILAGIGRSGDDDSALRRVHALYV